MKVRILRQQFPGSAPYWETFEYDGPVDNSVAGALDYINYHDDIVDATPLRRGKPTVAAAFGKITAVYTGNYLLCEAIRAIIANADRHTEDVAVRTATEMCRGEFLQLRTEAAPDFDGGDYILRVRRKTANLMAAACDIGAHTAGAGEEVSAAMAAFGESLGIAFQITDDILDYVGDDAFGKTAGGDLREGLATMPLICAWESGGERKRMKELFFASRSSEQAVAELIDVVRANDGAGLDIFHLTELGGHVEVHNVASVVAV